MPSELKPEGPFTVSGTRGQGGNGRQRNQQEHRHGEVPRVGSEEAGESDWSQM